MKTYLDILTENKVDLKNFPEDKFPFISFDLIMNEYFHEEKEVTYNKLAATDIGKQSNIQNGIIYSSNSFFLNEVIQTPLVCTSDGIILDFMKDEDEDDEYIFISYEFFNVKLVKSHYSDNPSLLLTGVDMLLSGAHSDLGIKVKSDEVRFLYEKLKYYLNLWKENSNIERLLEFSYSFGDIKVIPSSKTDNLRYKHSLSSSLEINGNNEEVKEDASAEKDQEAEKISSVSEEVKKEAAKEQSPEESKDEKIRILEERIAQLKLKEEEDRFLPKDKKEEAIEKSSENDLEAPSINTKSKPIWKIIQEEFLVLETGNIERKKFKEHILQMHPHINPGTLSAQIALQVINKRARTGYAQCNKERVCGEDKLDFLFENENGCLYRYNKDSDGIWEIYSRQDGKLDVKLTK